jgi:hypothetical protein
VLITYEYLNKIAADAGEDAKVMSVFAAGRDGEIDLDDLGLKKNYSVSNAATAAPTYNDMMLEASCLEIIDPTNFAC